jgi:hypothetical protein
MRCRNLSGLNLEGEISPAVGSLKSLVSMYGCAFLLAFVVDWSVTSWLLAYVNFVYLACSDLKSNGLTGQIPDEIGDCSSIKTL